MSQAVHKPRHIVVLSPHRDDAAFSTGLLLTRLLRAGTDVHLVNVCTESDYAPYLPEASPPGAAQQATVSAIRRTEDERFLETLHHAAGAGRCTLHDLPWLDSPLRLNIATNRVLDFADATAAEVNSLAATLQPWRAADAVLAPLGLGNHLDHRLVRDAARQAFASHQLGFYEDLPYACWLQPTDRQAAAAAILQQIAPETTAPWTTAHLRIVTPLHPQQKKLYALCYPSQIAADLADSMNDDALILQQAERMHLPPSLVALFDRAL